MAAAVLPDLHLNFPEGLLQAENSMRPKGEFLVQKLGFRREFRAIFSSLKGFHSAIIATDENGKNKGTI